MENMYFEKPENLSADLKKIEQVFDVRQIIREGIGKGEIVDYYFASSTSYRLFHSKKGAVHMALNYDGTFDKGGYYQHGKEILAYIPQNVNSNVLELGSGKGFNTLFLAENRPNSYFFGIDITEKHLSIARKNAVGQQNVFFHKNDFHDIAYEQDTFDLVYEIEAACHAQQPETVLEQVYRVLKPGGRFILYDGFRTAAFESLNEDQRKAAILLEKTMQVDRFHTLEKWLVAAENTGFEVENADDISQAILPTLKRLHKMGRIYYAYPPVSKIVRRLLPDPLSKNSIAALLFHYCVTQKMHSYHRVVLKKQ